uniref:ORF556 n=1 Tax=Trypanosoma brucei TaxID=5691 RepID=Q9GU92_9TRYP|nr:ORF556 [Trypanosoma brucei]
MPVTTHFSSIGAKQSEVIETATTLGWTNDHQAQDYLQKLLIIGRPILRAHNWKIHRLKEFYPRSARLLGQNFNRGEEVCVRFRVPKEKNTFFPFQEVVCTFLHELAHCKYSKHDRHFWELYTELSVECCRLDLNASLEREAAAPPDRRHTGSGRRLGGSRIVPLPREPEAMRRILSEAAERRRQSSENGQCYGCAHDKTGVGSELNDGLWTCDNCDGVIDALRGKCEFCVEVGDSTEQVEEWSCKRCSFHNHCALVQCEACGRLKSGRTADGTNTVHTVKALAASSDHLLFTMTLGRVADALAPILQEMRWSVACLEEFAPPLKRVMSRSSFKNSNECDTLSIRLRSPNNPHEPLTFTCVLAHALHQLAHLTEKNHGANFVHAWIAMIHRFLTETKAFSDDFISSQEQEDLLCLAMELELLLNGLSGRDTALCDDLLDNVPHLQRLFENCATFVKRERLFTVATTREAGVVGHSKHLELWQCRRCSVNNNGGFIIFCEVCGAPRQLSVLLRTSRTVAVCAASNETVIDISDDDGDDGSATSAGEATISPGVVFIID